MQEVAASLPYFDPPLEAFRNLYETWGAAQFGLIITGQVQGTYLRFGKPESPRSKF